ncbi:MAG: DNA-binding domain-containing protein [Marinifilaceae bacterium]
MIDYFLVENPLTKDRGDCFARVVRKQSITREQLIKDCCGRGSSLTEAEVRAVFCTLEDVILEHLEEGHNINTPLCHISPSISGVFSSEDDRFDRARHQVNFNIKEGTLLRKRKARCKFRKKRSTPYRPLLYTFVNHSTGDRNKVATPGGIGKIDGAKLKLNLNYPEDGIYWVAKDRTETKVEIIVTNTDSRLMFQIPDLPPGEYTLYVKKHARNANTACTGYLYESIEVVGDSHGR